ncbi:MAG: SMP-30/gluconolactonase/LRE family protein [Ilyomonas sp.]
MKLVLFILVISTMYNSYKPQPLKATLVLDAKAELGEGSIWNPIENKLYWINIEGKTLHIYDPETKKDIEFPTGSRVGTVVPVKDGGVLVALQKGIYKMDTNNGDLSFITQPIQDSSIRFNDGKCDPSGRFWVGTMALDQRKGAAVLYRMDKDKSIHTMVENVTISNGIVWTSDKKTMYYIDTPTGEVVAYDYDDATGEISNKRVAVKVEDGSPDGMTIDENDHLWVALWGGNAVGCYDPKTGKLIQKVEVPAPNITSCAFGGKDLKTLYITTARGQMSDEQLKKYPQSGGVFSVQLNVKGVPANFYGQ